MSAPPKNGDEESADAPLVAQRAAPRFLRIVPPPAPEPPPEFAALLESTDRLIGLLEHLAAGVRAGVQAMRAERVTLAKCLAPPTAPTVEERAAYRRHLQAVEAAAIALSKRRRRRRR